MTNVYAGRERYAPLDLNGCTGITSPTHSYDDTSVHEHPILLYQYNNV